MKTRILRCSNYGENTEVDFPALLLVARCRPLQMQVGLRFLDPLDIHVMYAVSGATTSRGTTARTSKTKTDALEGRRHVGRTASEVQSIFRQSVRHHFDLTRVRAPEPVRRLSQVQQPIVEREPNKLGPGFEFELAHDARAMSFNRSS